MNARRKRRGTPANGHWTSRVRRRLSPGRRGRAALGLLAVLAMLATGSPLRAEARWRGACSPTRASTWQ